MFVNQSINQSSFISGMTERRPRIHNKHNIHSNSSRVTSLQVLLINSGLICGFAPHVCQLLFKFCWLICGFAPYVCLWCVIQDHVSMVLFAKILLDFRHLVCHHVFNVFLYSGVWCYANVVQFEYRHRNICHRVNYWTWAYEFTWWHIFIMSNSAGTFCYVTIIQ